jgi:hypothetical protein
MRPKGGSNLSPRRLRRAIDYAALAVTAAFRIRDRIGPITAVARGLCRFHSTLARRYVRFEPIAASNPW